MNDITYKAFTSQKIIDTLISWKTLYESNENYDKLAILAKYIAIDAERCRSTDGYHSIEAFLCDRIDRLVMGAPHYEDIEWLALSLKKGVANTDKEIQRAALCLMQTIQAS